ncbi:MAG: aspartate dehydrogenase [Eubacterium sp.]|nr:aspartate dehydrogenase [Eubacterium sp.]
MFGKKKTKTVKPLYDTEKKEPIIKASICNGEQVAGFRDIESGVFHEVMFIRNNEELESFKRQYGIQGDIKKIY